MKRMVKKAVQRSISQKMFAVSVISVFMSAVILMTGCSGTAADPSKSAEAESGTEAMLGSVGSSSGGVESGVKHISEQVSDQLVVDAEVVLPKEQAYSVYALTKKTFPREDLDLFFGASEAVVTDHPAWTGAYFAKTKEGGYFRTDPHGNFTYAKDEEKDEYIVYLVESAYYNAQSRSFREEKMPDLSFLSAAEAILAGKERIRELTGQDAEVLVSYALNREKLTKLGKKYRQTEGYQADVQIGKASAEVVWSDADEMYYMEYGLTKDCLPIYSGINEPGISMAVETNWAPETRITMLLDKDGIRYISCLGGLFDAVPEAGAQTIFSAEAALEAVKEIYVNTILDSQVTISRVWLEYIACPDWKEKEQFKLVPYWCVQADTASGNGSYSSVERINAITGGNLAYGE